MYDFVTFFVGGVELGTTLALVGLGLVLCYRATQTFNFAHGQFMYLGAVLVALWQGAEAQSAGRAVFESLATLAVIGGLLYAVVLRRTVGLPEFIPVIATLGVGLVINGIVQIVVGSSQYYVKLSWLPTGATTIHGVRVGTAGLLLAGFGASLSLLVLLALKTTNFGLRLRAAGQSPLLASQSGIRIHWIYLASWAIAATLAAVAGISYATTTVVSPTIEDIALLAFPAIILGGFDSIGGALIGGLLVGFLEAAVATYWVPTYTEVVTYCVLLAVMLFRPQGLYGTKEAS